MQNSAIAYVRVSTEEQANEGVSLEAQESAVRAYAKMRSLELVHVVIDAGVSAGKPLEAREGGQKVLDAVRRRQVFNVIAFKLDRLFRDCADCLAVTADWDRLNIALHLVDMGGQSVDTSSALGRFFVTILAGAAEMERNLIRERTSAALQHKRRKHEYTGGNVPYGWCLDEHGDLVVIPEEQEAIVHARRLRNLGLSLRGVGHELRAQGFLPRTGGTWHASQVAGMVRDAAA